MSKEIITGKSKNLENVPDEFFDAIEGDMGSMFNAYCYTGIGLRKEMVCVYCGEKDIRYRSESWGSEVITFSGLHCNKCKKRVGITGCRSYNLDKTEVGKFVWLFNFIISSL